MPVHARVCHRRRPTLTTTPGTVQIPNHGCPSESESGGLRCRSWWPPLENESIQNRLMSCADLPRPSPSLSVARPPQVGRPGGSPTRCCHPARESEGISRRGQISIPGSRRWPGSLLCHPHTQRNCMKHLMKAYVQGMGLSKAQLTCERTSSTWGSRFVLSRPRFQTSQRSGRADCHEPSVQRL